MSEIHRAVADPTRRRILELLRRREMNAGEIAEHFALSKPKMECIMRPIYDRVGVVGLQATASTRR